MGEWVNRFEINGVLETKPKIIDLKNAKGGKLVDFYIVQTFTKGETLEETKKTIHLTSFSRKVIDALENADHQCYVDCAGIINSKWVKLGDGKGYYDSGIQVTEIEITKYLREGLRNYGEKNCR